MKRIRSNLHVVLAMSPVGGSLRTRMRMFPALVNCCTIDWLNPWPDEALMTVAKMFLSDLDFDGINPQMVENLSRMCMNVHQNINDTAEEFYKVLRRKVYTTPKSYIDLIQNYKDLLKMKKNQNQTERLKLTNGLFKLEEAEKTITGLKDKLTELQPKLVKSSAEVSELIKKLDVDKLEANKKKVLVQQDEIEVSKGAANVQLLKDDADKKLKEATPILTAAVEALDTLNRNDISEIKSNNKPH